MNPLFDIDFLTQLTLHRSRETFARITALTQKEQPIEYIEGKVTGGSVNVDGNSAVRRTCSLTMVAKDLDINSFYWGLKNKFKLEVGIKNNIDPRYPEIIWFPQGLYVITSFNTSQSTNNFTVSISGKDKMCLINGDLGGALPSSVDFGIEEYHDKINDTVTYTSIPIKNIIREAIQNYGNELPGNIIINDIEDAGLELLEYRGDTPLYMFKNNITGQIQNMTINSNQKCYYALDKIIDSTRFSALQKDGHGFHNYYVSLGNGTYELKSIFVNTQVAGTISDSYIIYDNLVDLEIDVDPTVISLDTTLNKQYVLQKFEYGSIPGYRLTDLTFAGDLIANVGETLTSVLDKIKNMLGEFEYFYNLDGKFVFQKKPYHIVAPWGPGEKDNEVALNEEYSNRNQLFSLTDGTLITAFSNNPNLFNLRNDYVVWGSYKTTSGAELPIHMRYAIDKKPEKYITWDGIEYTSQEYDWRELIYQMALDYRRHYHEDDFLYTIAEKNPHFEGGRTGYEQYYTDLEGFWRDLYNPNPELKDRTIDIISARASQNCYIKNGFKLIDAKDIVELKNKYLIEDLYYYNNGQLYSFIGSPICQLQKETEYWFKNSDNEWLCSKTPEILNKYSLKNLYVQYIEKFYDKNNLQLMTNADEQFYMSGKDGNEYVYVNYIDVALSNLTQEDFSSILYIDSDLNQIQYHDEGNYTTELFQDLYSSNNIFAEKISYITCTDNYGEKITTTINDIQYYEKYSDYHLDGEDGKYWAKIVMTNPESLLFWFDFMDAEGSDLAKYSVPVVGARTKSINDKDVKSIYYREIPTTIFKSVNESGYEIQTGYTYIQLQPTMENLFTISSKGKSAKERIDELLYNHSYCIESASITTIPIYHLQPNSRILVKDPESKIDGEYIVSKLTIPLTYNGTMNITATKAVSNIY